YIRISQEYRSTFYLFESQDVSFTQEESLESLKTVSAVNRLEKKSWYCGSSSSSFDGGDRETICNNGVKIAYLNTELCRPEIAKERRNREEREGGDMAAKEVENKRYATPAQLTFLFESGNILPPCSASSDESDQEGDENDKFDKESEGDEE
ncbi:hypothetical protein H5410_064650, partial [Solanum commersonii]